MCQSMHSLVLLVNTVSLIVYLVDVCDFLSSRLVCDSEYTILPQASQDWGGCMQDHFRITAGQTQDHSTSDKFPRVEGLNNYVQDPTHLHT